MRAWSRAYREDGLVVIGVHTPEFSFEHEIDGVRRAMSEREIGYPIASRAWKRSRSPNLASRPTRSRSVSGYQPPKDKPPVTLIV